MSCCYLEKTMKVIINEQHSLSNQQQELLNGFFGPEEWQRYDVPAEGWTKEQIMHHSEILNEDVIFVSPIPFLMKLLFIGGRNIYVFHNDRREKKELPGGRVVYTVPEDGWEIL